MEEQILPKSVYKIIDQHIFSVSQLETLLLLRLHADRKWTSQQLSAELQTNESAAQDMLCKLAQSGLIKRCANADVDSFRYDVAENELDYQVSQLADSYQQKRMRVIERIYQKPGRTQSFGLLTARPKLNSEDQEGSSIS